MANNCSPHCECKTGSAANRGKTLIGVGASIETPAEFNEPAKRAARAKPYDSVGAIIAFEQGDLDNEGIIDLFAHLVKTGLAWSLQGSYGRMTINLIERGFIDRQGNVLTYSED